MSTSALAELTAHATDRMAEARRWRAAGRQVVGYVGADTPVELLTAAGMLPVRLGGAPDGDSREGDRYLGRGLDPAARSLLSRLLAGDYGHLDGLVVSRDCEASSRLFYALRELRRIEPSVGLPPVHLVDVLHLPHHTTTRYVQAMLRQLRGTLEAWAGHEITDDEVGAAIGAHDRLRTRLAELAEARRARPARLTGTRMLSVLAATQTLPVERATELVEKLLAEVPSLPEVHGRRTFLTGSGHDTVDVYSALEAAGLLIVGEDHDWGELPQRHRVGAPTELALAERYQHNGPTAPRASIRDRAAHTATAARACAAEVLLSYVRVHDDAPPWDFPAQRATTGLPAALLERQPYGALTEDAMKTVAMLRDGQEVRA